MDEKRRRYERRPRLNRNVRALIEKHGLKYKDIAEHIHVSQTTLSQWFSYELRDWQKKEILGAIAELRLKGEKNEEADK